MFYRLILFFKLFVLSFKLPSFYQYIFSLTSPNVAQINDTLSLVIAGIAWVNSSRFSTPPLISFRGVTTGSVAKCWLFSQSIAGRIRKIISYFILTYITGERIENKQVLVNKSMPVVTSSGLQPGDVAFTIYLWFPHVILRPCELFLRIVLTLYMNENNHLIASLTHNSTEFHQALPQFEMFDANSCIWQNSELQRNVWFCNQKFVVPSEVSFYKPFL